MALTAPTRRMASRLKSCRALADTSHMPIYIAMAHSHQPDPPASADDEQMPPTDPTSAEAAPIGGSGEAGVTPEQLAKVVRRLESGFYDRAEVREQIARRVLDEPDQ